MYSQFGVIVAKADAQDKFLGNQEFREALEFHGSFSARIEAAREIAKKSYNLAEGAIQSIYTNFPFIPKTLSKDRKGKLVQDIQDWLRYISYSLILGNTSYLDENVTPGLFKVLLLYNLSPGWYINFLQYVRKNHGFSGSSAAETNIYIDYLVNILGSSTSYADNDTDAFQFISTQIYLNTSKSLEIDEVKKALLDFFEAFDLEIEIDFPAKISSWYKRFFLRAKDVASSSEFQSRVEKAERALELKLLQREQSEIDKNQAEAVSRLLDSLNKTEDGGVLSVGSILVVKRKREPAIAYTLTPEQMIYIQKNPSLIYNSEKVIESISQIFLPK